MQIPLLSSDCSDSEAIITLLRFDKSARLLKVRFYYEFVAWDDMLVMYLNAALILLSFAGICAFTGKSKKGVIIKSVAGLLGAAILFGLNFLVNNVITDGTNPVFSVSVILSLLIFIITAVLISYYVKNAKEFSKMLRALGGGISAVAGLAVFLMVFKRVGYAVLAVAISFGLNANLLDKGDPTEVNNLIYTELSQASKKPRDYGKFESEENDIFVDETNRVGGIFSLLSHHRTCRSAHGGSIQN